MAIEYLDQPSVSPQPSQQMTNTELAYNIVRAIGQGAFGLGDEAEAFARSNLGDETYEQALADAKANLEQFRTEMPEVAYPLEIAASIPAAMAGGAALQAARVGSKLAQATLMGGAYGAGAGEGVEGRALGAGMGALTAAGLQKVTPEVSKRAQELMRRKVPVTVGQAFGGATQRLEEAATSIPFAGDVIKSAQRRAMERFSSAAYNEALAPIGKKIPKGLTGREAYKAAEQQITKTYDDVIEVIDFPAGGDFVKSVDDLVNNASFGLPEKEAKLLSKVVERALKSRISDGRLAKESFKKAQSELRDRAYKYKTSSDAYTNDLGDAIYDVAGELFDALAEQAPDVAGELKKIDTVYSRFVPLQKASAKAAEGVMTPAQVLSQVRSQGRGRTSAMARGELPMQEFAEKAQDVLGSKVPDSGSPLRYFLGMGALGGGGSIVGMPLEAAALGAVGGGLYTRPFQAGLRKALPFGARMARTPAAAGLLSQEIPTFGILGE